MDSTQLPADTIADIKDKATKYSKGDMSLFVAYTKIATEYARNLLQLQQDYDFLKLKYDNILATESGHESKTENVWQSGYAAGHEAATNKDHRNVNVYDIINKGQNGDL
jgi:hypothetical protein